MRTNGKVDQGNHNEDEGFIQERLQLFDSRNDTDLINKSFITLYAWICG